LVERSAREGFAGVEDAVAGCGGDALARLNALLQAGFDVNMKMGGPEQLAAMASLLRPDNAHLYGRILAVEEALFQPLLTRLISEGVADGVFDTFDPEGVADMIYGLAARTNSKILDVLQAGDESARERAIDRLTTRFRLHGLAIDRILGLPDGSITTLTRTSRSDGRGTAANLLMPLQCLHPPAHVPERQPPQLSRRTGQPQMQHALDWLRHPEWAAQQFLLEIHTTADVWDDHLIDVGPTTIGSNGSTGKRPQQTQSSLRVDWRQIALSLKRVRRTPVKITTMIMTAVAAVVMAMTGVTSVPNAAAAYPIVGKLGSELTMTDSVGQVVLTWTVSDLKPSTDVTPGYTATGKLWEATATVRAIQGGVTPAISQFNAVAPNQAAYRVLWYVDSPTNISGATIPQGAQSTGKIHFDVTGPSPTTVTMNNGMEDLLIWGP